MAHDVYNEIASQKVHFSAIFVVMIIIYFFRFTLQLQKPMWFVSSLSWVYLVFHNCYNFIRWSSSTCSSHGPENIESCYYFCSSEVGHFLNEFYALQVSLYLDKFSGVCQSVLHDCKLIFLQIICDHDLFVEMPGRDPSDRYFILPLFVCFATFVM